MVACSAAVSRQPLPNVTEGFARDAGADSEGNRGAPTLLGADRRIDPAQPPLEGQWAEAWLRLARVRLRNGRYSVAAKAAEVAAELEPLLQGEASAVRQQAELAVEDLFATKVACDQGTLVLERCIDLIDHGDLYTGGIVWECGQTLVELLPGIADLRGRSLLELGSGTGVLGLGAACCGASVLLTDLAEATPLLERNVARNLQLVQRSGGSATVSALDWRCGLDDCPSELLTPHRRELVLASDCVWRPWHCRPLVQWLAAYGAPCLFALTRRPTHTEVRQALDAACGAGALQFEAFLVGHARCEFGVIFDPRKPASGRRFLRLPA